MCTRNGAVNSPTTYRKSSSDVPPEEHGDNIDDVGLGGQGLEFSHCLDIPKARVRHSTLRLNSGLPISFEFGLEQ